MKNFIALLIVLFMCSIMGCKSTDTSKPYEWELGEETTPLYGCKELRKQNPNADC